MTQPDRRARIWSGLLWLLPPLVCLAAFYPAFQVWFLRDDFRWLGLSRLMEESADPLTTMLAPYAQGTIRVLSERVFFVGLTSLFDLNAIPFRIVVFLTQFANLALVNRLGFRITGSRAAACIAACLWALSPRMAVPMYWTCVYNQILCAFFVLLALECLDRYLTTGKTKWLLAQYAAFLLSFGALELGVVYPALATLWIWIFGRDKWKSTVPLWIAAIAFTAAQLLLVPKSASPAYQLFFDTRLLRNFYRYFVWSMGPSRIGYMIDQSLRFYGFAFAAVLIVALAAFAYRRRSLLLAFCLLWFAAFLAPVLPLANHVSDYYLAIPTIGICWLIGWMFADFWNRGTVLKVAVFTLAALFAAGSIWEDRETTGYYAEQTGRMKKLIRAVQVAHQAEPQKLILIQGVDNDLFAAGFQDDPFYAAGAALSANQPLVFLAPGSEAGLTARADLGGVSRYVISADRAVRALEQNQAVALQVSSSGVREVTASYRAVVQSQRTAIRRTSIDLGDTGSADLLGEGWHAAEKGFRWMGKRATVRLAGPQNAAERLYVDGFIPAGAVASGPVTLTLRVDGKPVGMTKLQKADSLLAIDFALPVSTVNQREVTVELEVSRTFQPPGDPRDLGVIISKIAIR